MSNIVRQTSFKTGEVDQSVWKRTDSDLYLTAAQKLLNIEITTTGTIKKRKSTRKVINLTDYIGVSGRTFYIKDNYGEYYLVILKAGKAEIFRFITISELEFFQEVDTSYTSEEVSALDYVNDDDSLIFAVQTKPQSRLYASSYDSMTHTPVFTFANLAIYPKPAYDFGKINYAAYGVTLSVTGTTLTFVFTGVGGTDPGFTSAWIGGVIIGGGTSVTTALGYAIITAVVYSSSGGGTVTFTATVQETFITDSDKYAKFGSQYYVGQPIWSEALGYPGKVTFFQNRLWFANSPALPNAVVGSKINQPVSFDVGTGDDTDAIIYRIDSSASGNILWLNGGKQLEIYAQNIELAAPQNENAALTPSTFTVRQQTAHGSSANLKPVAYSNDSYYVNRTGKSIINYHFDGVGLSYSSSIVSAPSQHLVRDPFRRAVQKGSDDSQSTIIYFLNSDKKITCFQFQNETGFAGLTPFEFSTDVEIIDIISINNNIYILKHYSQTGVINLDIVEEYTDDTLKVKIDGAFDDSMDSTGLIDGLSDYEGYDIQVIYNGQDFGVYEVVDGEITVDNPLEISGAVTLGFLYDVDIRSMYIFAGPNNNAVIKQVNSIFIDYMDSLNFRVNGQFIPYQTFEEIQDGISISPKTGTEIIYPIDGFDRFQTISITQSSPYNLEILGISYQVVASVI